LIRYRESIAICERDFFARDFCKSLYSFQFILLSIIPRDSPWELKRHPDSLTDFPFNPKDSSISRSKELSSLVIKSPSPIPRREAPSGHLDSRTANSLESGDFGGS